jgi:MoxR-like ATPase
VEVGESLEQVRRDLEAVEGELARVIVGQRDVVGLLLTALLADGHVLLEGLPGLGKTLLVTTLRDALGLKYSRVQFTPDLMPADITGTNVIELGAPGGKHFRFEPGPVFTNLLLADEINRASPKTQSALLQAMQEKEVTVFGRHFPLEEPFVTIATQNPIELEGTYPLPEAQLDRFLFKIVVGQPGLEDLVEIANRTTGPNPPSASTVLDRARILAARRAVARLPVADPVMRFAARLVLATQPERPGAPEPARRFVRYGASTRAMQGLVAAAKVAAVRDGRVNVAREDLLAHLLPVLRHRVVLNFDGEMQKIRVDELLLEIARAVPAND